jgi:hypothetical protein
MILDANGLKPQISTNTVCPKSGVFRMSLAGREEERLGHRHDVPSYSVRVVHDEALILLHLEVSIALWRDIQ